jgi:alpha-tubulin suppressor-like RCC1 family protein
MEMQGSTNGVGRPMLIIGLRPTAAKATLVALACTFIWATALAAVARAEEPSVPKNTAAPTISRAGSGGEEGALTTAIEETALTATSGSWSGSPAPTYSYQWLSCTSEGESESCTTISGATSSSFTPSASYLGKGLKIEVTATNTAGTGAPARSARTSEVRALGGDAVATGRNTNAELGAGYKDNYEDQPVPVVDLPHVTAIAAGDEFSLALLDNGTVRAWGLNDFAQLGDGEGAATGEPWSKLEDYATVSGLTGVKRIAAANDHALALLENGTVETWGNNFYGQLGNGTNTNTEGENTTQKPVVVPGLRNVIAIAAGGSSDYALLSDHKMMAWGGNTSGELGIGETGPHKECNGKKNECDTVPREVGAPVLNGKGEVEKNEHSEAVITPLSNVVAIAAGENAGYALLEDGRVMAWGVNTEGQLGNGAKEVSTTNLTPTEVKTSSGEPLEEVKAISGGANDALALLKDGKVDGWGKAGESGVLGELSETEKCGAKERRCVKSAVQIHGLEDVTAISAGEGYTLALSEGTVYGLGGNEHGQLGDGNTTATPTPKAMKGLGSVAAISAQLGSSGYAHSLVLLAEGVEPPSPLLSVEPGAHSLKLRWNLTTTEFEVKYKEWRPLECEVTAEEEEEKEEPAEPCEKATGWLATFKLGDVSGYELTGLTGEKAYKVAVKAHNKNNNHKTRTIVGTTLA